MPTEFPRSPVPGLAGPNGERIMRFDDSAIQGQLDRALAGIGDSRAYAVVNVVQERATGERVIRGAVAFKFGEHWSAGFVAEHTKDYNSGALGVRLSK